LGRFGGEITFKGKTMKYVETKIGKLGLIGLIIGSLFLFCCQSNQKAPPPPGDGQPPKQDGQPPAEVIQEMNNSQPAPDGVATPPPIVTEEMQKASIGEPFPKEQCKQICSNKKMIQLAIKCKITRKKTSGAVTRECIKECENQKIGTKTLECFDNFTKCDVLFKCASAPSVEDSGVFPEPQLQNQGTNDNLTETPPLPSGQSETSPEPVGIPPDTLDTAPVGTPPNPDETEPKADSKTE
jgi:hypothetical protein